MAEVVITDCDHANVNPERAILDDAGVDWRLEQCRTTDEVIERCADATVLIVQYVPITADLLDALPDVRLIARYGVGVDNIDVAAATERGVYVCNVPDYGTTEVADHTITLALAVLRGIPVYDRSTRDGAWDYTVGLPIRRLSELTFGVVGCGLIGTDVATRAAAFGFRILAHEPNPDRTVPDGAERVDLDTLLGDSDVISLHATLGAGTKHLLDAAAIARCKPTAYVVNTSRGGLVDTSALMAALDDGRLAGAALDVTETEPADPELLAALTKHPRVLVTPHAAWYSTEAFHAMKTGPAEEAVRLLRGETLRSPLNDPARPRGVADAAR